MEWEREYSRKRDMSVKLQNKETGEETDFFGKDCTFVKTHFPGAKEVKETITCERASIQKGDGNTFTCSEWAIKQLTGRNILVETGLQPSDFGLENLPDIPNPPCKLFSNNPEAVFKEKNIILRIVPTGQEDRHSIILREVNPIINKAVIEDESGIREVNLDMLMRNWEKTNYLYAKCEKEQPLEM